MEGKLIKTANGYGLESELGPAFVLSTRPKHNWLKLSIKNCEAIANGYDLDELADEMLEKAQTPHKLISPSTFRSGTIKGFQKALELRSDKKFSEEDILDAWEDGATNKHPLTKSKKENLLKSLQQTEWDVEIEMEEVIIGQCDCECHSNTGIMIMHFMPCCNPKIVSNPKLDSNGCLILKKI